MHIRKGMTILTMFNKSTKSKWLNWMSLVGIALSCILLQKIFVPKFDLVAGNLISNTHTDHLQKENIVSQPFIANKDGLSTIQVLFTKQKNSYPQDATILWVLLSGGENPSILAQGSIPVQSIKNESFYTLKFTPIKDSGGQTYILRVSTSSSLETNGLAMASSSVAQSEFYSYQLNNKDQNGTIVFYTGYSTPNFNLLIIIFGGIFAVPLWILFLFHEKVVKTLEEQPLHRTVTIIIVGIGMLMIIIQPPLHMFDEPEHFRRIWEVSTGKLLPSIENGSVSTHLPVYIQGTINRIYRSVNGTTQNPAQIIQMLVERGGAESELSPTGGLSSSYSFLAYLIPALFVRIGIWLGSSALGLMYLARLASLVVFASLTYWALKHAIVGKQTIAVVALLGLVITQGVAINVDSLMMGGTYIFLAAAFNLIWSRNNLLITKQEILPLAAGAFFILISKHIYIPLLALIILIPTAKFGNVKEKWKWVLIFLLVAGLFSIFLQVLVTLGNDPRIDTSDINPVQQLRFILSSPVNWLKTFSLTLVNNGYSYFDQFNRLNGTHTSIGIFGIFQLVSVLFFSWSESDSLPARITKWQQTYSCLIALITGMFIMLPLYLYWTPVGASVVNGLQGRYFLPPIVLVLIISRPNITYSGQHIKTKLLVTMTSLLLVQTWMVYSFFY